MLVSLKSLVVVLVIAAIVFALAKPVCLRFTQAADFDRRRAVWLALTGLAFMSPSFWLYALFAVPLLTWSARRDHSPLAVYMLFYFAIPPMEISIPIVGINQLFDLNQVRLLGLIILLPCFARTIGTHTERRAPGLVFADWLVILFGVLQVLEMISFESGTASLRRAFLYFLDVALVYFSFSRMRDRAEIADVLGALFMSACLFAPMAVFESIRGWQLYVGIADSWGAPNVFAWLLREGSLRAQVSAGHAITLGYVFAMGLGCWFFLRIQSDSWRRNMLVPGALLSGLYVTYSRGPWVTAALLWIIFFVMSASSIGKAVKGIMLALCVAIALLLSPLGGSIADKLPFIGTVDQGTVSYRQQLAEVSWSLVQQNPWFGDPMVLTQMEELRQGQGIIDIVNAYAAVALFHGLVGLALYSLVFVSILAVAYGRLRKARAEGDMSTARMGACVIACLLATLVFMATGGNAWFQWLLAGLVASYAVLSNFGCNLLVEPDASIQAPSRFAPS